MVNLFYNSTLPQQKKFKGGSVQNLWNSTPPGLALDSEPIFLHDTLLHGTPSCQVWLKMVEQFRKYRPDKIRHTDRRSDSNITPPSPPPHLYVRVWGRGYWINIKKRRQGLNVRTFPQSSCKWGKSHQCHKGQHFSQSIIQASTILAKLHALRVWAKGEEQRSKRWRWRWRQYDEDNDTSGIAHVHVALTSLVRPLQNALRAHITTGQLEPDLVLTLEMASDRISMVTSPAELTQNTYMQM